MTSLIRGSDFWDWPVKCKKSTCVPILTLEGLDVVGTFWGFYTSSSETSVLVFSIIFLRASSWADGTTAPLTPPRATAVVVDWEFSVYLIRSMSDLILFMFRSFSVFDSRLCCWVFILLALFETVPLSVSSWPCSALIWSVFVFWLLS